VKLLELLHHLDSVGSLTDHLETLGLDDVPDHLPHEGSVVGDENSRHASPL